MQDVRVKLATEIDRRCFARAALAKQAGLTPQQLSDILHLRRKLEATEMFAICDAMGIACSELNPYADERTLSS